MKKQVSKAVMFGLLLTLAAGSAFANEGHEGKGEGFSVDKKVARMKEKLDLTDDQTARIKTIYENAHAAMKAQHVQVQSEVSSVLNDEQKTKFAEIKKNMKEKRGHWKDKKCDSKEKHADD